MAPPSPQSTVHSPQNLFSRIASKYDLLNSVLSFGNDRRWRKRAVHESIRPNDQAILDVGTGSGKLLKAYCEHHPFKRGVGIDFCGPMLERAREDLASFPGINLREMDILQMGFEERFDLITTSFVLRSISDHLPDFFRRAYSLLNPGGRFVILELTRPKNPFVHLMF